MTADLSTLNAAQFTPYVGGTFRFLEPETSFTIIEVELRQVTERPEFTPRWAKRTSFSVLFEAFADTDFQNGNCLIEHPTEGPLGPFLIIRTVPLTLERPCFELVLT